MRLKQIATAKLLAAATFGIYVFDYRKAWAEEIPVETPPAVIETVDSIEQNP